MVPAAHRQQRVFVAGHRGMVGSALVRRLQAGGYTNVITAPRAQLDLLDSQAVKAFLVEQEPECIFVAAAKVGGIQANHTQGADFLYENLMIDCLYLGNLSALRDWGHAKDYVEMQWLMLRKRSMNYARARAT